METDDGGAATIEDQSKLNAVVRNIRARTKELLHSVEQLERQRSIPPAQWLISSEQIARQFRSLSEQIAPMLDHWVFLPQESSDRLPELLRTKLEADQEKKEDDLVKQLPPQIGETDELQQRQAKVNDSCAKLLAMVNENKDLQHIASRKRNFAAARMNASTSSLGGNNAKQQQLISAGGGAKLFSLLYAKPQDKQKGFTSMEMDTMF